jgi:hypothetical protein
MLWLLMMMLMLHMVLVHRHLVLVLRQIVLLLVWRMWTHRHRSNNHGWLWRCERQRLRRWRAPKRSRRRRLNRQSRCCGNVGVFRCCQGGFLRSHSARSLRCSQCARGNPGARHCALKRNVRVRL